MSRKRIPAVTAIASAGHDEAAVDWNSTFILDGGNKPGRVRIRRMHHDGEPEGRWLDILQFFPRLTVIPTDEDAIVVLGPEDVRR